jgi:hypothetical protein
MIKNKSLLVSTEKLRSLTLTLEPVSGSLTLFYAFVDGVKVIQSDGTKKRTWKGEIPDKQVKIKIRVTGINNAAFKVGIDLPGTANNQSLTFQLQGGYYETDISL